MKTTKKTRILSLLLSVVMIMSMVPLGVFNFTASALSDAEIFDLRNKIVKYMNDMATVEWVAGEQFNNGGFAGSFYKGKKYYGIPYKNSGANSNGSLGRFKELLAKNNGKLSSLPGHNDCSTAVGYSYKRYIDSFPMTSSSPMDYCPGKHNFIKVGNYELKKNSGDTAKTCGKRTCSYNGKTVMFSSYSKMLPGDVLIGGEGHIMMVVSVNAKNNTVTVTHQMGTYAKYDPKTGTSTTISKESVGELKARETKNSTWGTNQVKSFSVLFSGNYFPARYKPLDPKSSIIKPSATNISSSTASNIAQNNSISVSWSKVTDATNYDIYVNGKVVKNTTGTTYAFVANEAKKYEVKVVAKNSAGSSAASNVLSFTAHNPCKVTFVNWDDSPFTAEPLSVEYGKNAVAPEIPVREGYTFTGWDKTLTSIKEDCTIKAQFKINTYNVKFFDSKGKILKSEKVVYNQSATAPTEVNTPTGYKFLGWNTDEYLSVKSDLSVYGIYDWGNRQLPIAVSNVSATRQQDGYYVYFDLTNYPDEITRGRAVVSLKTAEGKLIDTTESTAFSIPKDGTKSGMEVFVPSDEVATKAELIIVNSYSSGVPISEMHSTDISFSENMWSNWSDTAPKEGTYSELDTRVMSRSSDKETTTASTSTKDGWNYDYTTSAWGPYGNWSAWSKTKYTKSDSRDVKTQTVTDKAAYTQYTLFYFRYKLNGKIYYTYSRTQSDEYNGEKKLIYVNSSDYVKTGKKYGDFVQYKAKSGSTYYSGELWFHESTCAADTKQIPAKTHTEYSYRDRSLIYTYHFYRWSDWSDWQENAITATENKQVETKTQYRYISNGAVEENNSGVERTVQGNVGAEYAGKQLSLFIYKVDEASDYSNEFVSQQTVAEDGSYSFTFKLREEPSINTGDFTVAIGIEGSNNTMVIDTIKAPKPTFEVKFIVDGQQIGEVQTVEQGSAAILPENPEKEGCTFCGWSADTTNVQSNLEVEANFVENKYTVVFVDWVAETVSIREFEYGAIISYSDAAEKEGYTFAGWEELENIDAVVTQNMVLTAKYDKDVFEVVFYDFYGNEISRQNVEYGNSVEFPEDPTEDEMVFCGWEANEDLYLVTCDVSAYATFVYEETCEPPYADITTNEFSEAQTVTLSCDTPNAVIFYTTDGSDPTDNFEAGNIIKQYTEPLTISKSCELKFYAVCDEMNSSEVVSETYVISNGSVDSGLMTFDNLPEYVVASPGKYKVHNETGYKYKNTISTSYESEAKTLEKEGWTLLDNTYGEWSEWSMTEPVADGQFIETEKSYPGPVDTPFFQYKHWKYYDDESDSYICTDTEIEGINGEWETIEVASSLTPSAFVGKTLAYLYNGEYWFYSTVVTKGVVPDFMIYRYRIINKNYYKWTDWTASAPTEGETREYITDSVFGYTVPASHLVTVHTDSEIGNLYYIVFENEPVVIDYDFIELEGKELAGFCTDSELMSSWDIDNDVVTAKLDLYPKYNVQQNTVTFLDSDGTVIDEQIINYGASATAPEYNCAEGYTFIGWDSEFDCITENITVKAITKLTTDLVTVKLNSNNRMMYADSLYKLVATVPENASDKTLVWTSDNENVAIVDENGIVTAISAGKAIITVTTVDGIVDSCTIIVKSNDIPESITVSSKELYITRYSTKQLSCAIYPESANTDIIWMSTNPAIASVDKNGIVTGNMAGSTVIIATSADGSKSDYCLIKVIGMNTLSTASIDFNTGIITGLASNLDSLDKYIELSDDSCELKFETLGTDSIVYLTRDDEIIDAYTVVVFGDVNGDGWYDGMDAMIVKCIAAGMLSKDDVGEAVWIAADCNHDGVIDDSDVELLEQAGVLLANVDQSKNNEELLETSSVYNEYLNLIDQRVESEEDSSTNEIVDLGFNNNLFEAIIEFVKYFIGLIKSVFINIL